MKVRFAQHDHTEIKNPKKRRKVFKVKAKGKKPAIPIFHRPQFNYQTLPPLTPKIMPRLIPRTIPKVEENNEIENFLPNIDDSESAIVDIID